MTDRVAVERSPGGIGPTVIDGAAQLGASPIGRTSNIRGTRSGFCRLSSTSVVWPGVTSTGPTAESTTRLSSSIPLPPWSSGGQDDRLQCDALTLFHRHLYRFLPR